MATKISENQSNQSHQCQQLSLAEQQPNCTQNKNRIKIPHFSHLRRNTLKYSVLMRERQRDGWREGWEIYRRTGWPTRKSRAAQCETFFPSPHIFPSKSLMVHSPPPTRISKVSVPPWSTISHPSRHPSHYLSLCNVLHINILRVTWEKWRILMRKRCCPSCPCCQLVISNE